VRSRRASILLVWQEQFMGLKFPHHRGNTRPTDDATRTDARRRAFLAKLMALGVGASGLELFSEYLGAAEISQSQPLRDNYDYIIVGAGSAGCLLAERLSGTGASVLLVEAGSDRITQPKIADVAPWLQNLGSDTDWGRASVAQPNLAGRPQSIPAGKVLGGSGSINAMIWLRGDPRDHQRWWRMVGNEWHPSALDRSYLKLVQSPNVCNLGAGRIKVGRYANRHPITSDRLISTPANRSMAWVLAKSTRPPRDIAQDQHRRFLFPRSHGPISRW
jgi:choline dehydrogenase